jgi:hypothetical protein
MKLVEVRTFPTELRGRDEYVVVEWKITALGAEDARILKQRRLLQAASARLRLV